MDDVSVPIRFLLAAVFGALIGLEREINEKKKLDPAKKSVAIVGLRSSALIGTLGAIAGFLYPHALPFSVLISVAFVAILVSFYILDSRVTKDVGITTEIAMLYSYLLGVLLALNVLPIQILIAMTIVLILLLTKKDEIKATVANISRIEIDAFISYAIVALVILPFLPNQTYSLSDIPGFLSFFENFGFDIERLARIELVNPFRVWFVVALITGIDVLGYILERTIGQRKGWILASIAGGFISSTATTQGIAQQSRKTDRISPLLAAALLANAVSFVQIAIIIGTVNSAFLVRVFPTIVIILLSALITTVYFATRKDKGTRQKTVVTVSPHQIFNLAPAVKFALLYLVITIVANIALTFFGDAAFLVTTAIGSLIGLDAVMITTAGFAGSTISFQLAVLAFIVANAVNLLAKSVYSFLQGKKEFAVKFSLSVGIIITLSLAGLVFV